ERRVQEVADEEGEDEAERAGDGDGDDTGDHGSPVRCQEREQASQPRQVVAGQTAGRLSLAVRCRRGAAARTGEGHDQGYYGGRPCPVLERAPPPRGVNVQNSPSAEPLWTPTPERAAATALEAFRAAAARVASR